MRLDAELLNIAQNLNVGSRQERNQIRQALEEFFSSRGYTAEMGSYNNGVLLLLAAPAEHALLRYDQGALRQHLDDRGLSHLVSEVKTRTKALRAA